MIGIIVERNNDTLSIGNFSDYAIPLLLAGDLFSVVNVGNSEKHRLTDIVLRLFLI